MCLGESVTYVSEHSYRSEKPRGTARFSLCTANRDFSSQSTLAPFRLLSRINFSGLPGFAAIRSSPAQVLDLTILTPFNPKLNDENSSKSALPPPAARPHAVAQTAQEAEGPCLPIVFTTGSEEAAQPFTLGVLTLKRTHLSPKRCGCGEREAFHCERMGEFNSPCVEAQWGGSDIQGLRVARDLRIGKVDRIANDGEAELPKVRADLVGAPGDGARFEEGGVVRQAFNDAEFGAGGKSSGEIDVARAGLAGFRADGSVAGELVFGGCADDFCKIGFYHFAPGELGLELRGKVARARDEHQAGGVRIQAMGRP